MLPGDILLEVFDFCRLEASEIQDKNFYNWWHKLVHVCQRWRQLIFTSPYHLNLQLLCTDKTPARKKLDCWPQIPITIDVNNLTNLSPAQEDNLFTALEHSDRVCSITLSLTKPHLEKAVKMMLKPFPVLTHLQLLTSPNPLILPSGFLGGPALGLQELDLRRISPPALPSILSSTSNLVHLHLHDLPITADVLPKVMAMGLAAAAKLKSLTIQVVGNYHTRQPLPAQKFKARTTLPALTHFQFQGSYKYLGNLVARLDTPHLFDLTIQTTSNLEGGVSRFHQLFQFIDCAEDLKLAQFRRARAQFNDDQSFIHFDNAQTGKHTHLALGEVPGMAEFEVSQRPLGPLF